MADYADTPFPNPHEHFSPEMKALLRQSDQIMELTRAVMAGSVRWRDDVNVADMWRLTSTLD